MKVFFQVLVYRNIKRGETDTGKPSLVPANDTEITIDLPDNGKQVGKNKINVYDDLGKTLISSRTRKPLKTYRPFTDNFGIVEFSARLPVSGWYIFNVQASIGSANKTGCILISDTKVQTPNSGSSEKEIEADCQASDLQETIGENAANE